MTDTRTAFEVFDSDGDGCLNEEEVGHVLRSMGYNPSQKQITEMCAASAADTQRITSAEFAKITMSAPRASSNTQYEKELTEALRVFDRDENGLIAENDLRVIFTTLGEPIDADAINGLLAQCTVNDQGKIKYADFVKLILQS